MSRGPEEFLPVPVTPPYTPPSMPAVPAVGFTPFNGGDLEDDDEEEGGVNAARLISAVLRHRWLVLAFAVAGLALGVGASKLAKPVFEAQASILIPARGSGSEGPIQTTRLFDTRGWVELVRTFEVLDEVVTRRQLFLSYPNAADSAVFAGVELASTLSPGSYVLTSDGQEMRLAHAEGAVLQTATTGDSIGSAVGMHWSPPALPAGTVIPFTIVPPRDAAVALASDLEVLPPPEGGSLLRMQLRGTDGLAIAATVNAVTDRVVEVATAQKKEKLSLSSDVLQQQVARAQVKLRAAENANESFRVATISLPTDRGATPIAAGLVETRDPVFDAFFQLRLDRDALVNDREAIQRALTLPSDSASALVVSLGTIPSVRSTPELTSALVALGTKRAEAQRLALSYTSAHPPLQRLEREIADIERNLVRAQANALTSNLGSRIGDFDRRIAASSREMQQIPPRVAEQMRRQREVEVATNLYTLLQAAFESAKLAELSASPDIRVLDRAVAPTTPVVDRILFIIAGGFGAGLALGILLAILLDRFDHRIRYPEQVTRGLGLRILGALPLVTANGRRRPDADAGAYLQESLRSIRMNLQYAHGVAGPFVTTISSPGPGEGKSFFAQHLAKTFADAGNKVLLIDGDTRRGALHQTLGVVKQPGLLDLLAGTARYEQVVRQVPSKGYALIPCGMRRANGPELLSSPAMAQLLQRVRGEYAMIIIDSPPLGAGIDALALGSLGGSLTFVLRNGMSDRELAEAKLHELHRLPIRILGAVLNDVRPTGAYRYYSYLPGYRAEDEIVERPSGPRKAGTLLGKG